MKHEKRMQEKSQIDREEKVWFKIKLHKSKHNRKYEDSGGLHELCGFIGGA